MRHDSQWLTLAEVAKERGISRKTAYRWITRGVLGVLLETVSRGYSIVTTREWLADFDRRITEVRNARNPAIIAATSRKSRKNGCAARLKAKHGL